MIDFRLHERLEKDCHYLGEVNTNLVLLMNNRTVPWFIIVPKVKEIEIHQLANDKREKLFDTVTKVSDFLCSNWDLDKINVGAIGNMVPQLHVHVVGRRRDDSCWPKPVWGNLKDNCYLDSEVQEIKQLFIKVFK